MTNMEVKQERERMERIGYVDVHDLCHDCLVELKRDYLVRLAEEGVFAEVMDVDYDFPAYGDFADADDIVPDDVVLEVYAGISFVPDDFFCLMEGDEDDV